MNSSNGLIKQRIMVIGSNGMLGQRLTRFFEAEKEVELFCCSAEDDSYFGYVNYAKLDLANKKQVQRVIKNFYPDYIINAAAFTNVDASETEKDLAWSINVSGVEHLVKYSVGSQAHLIHISSDYIFDGSCGPYSENDLPNPISYYGRTKLAGENALAGDLIKSTIIRTNVLYGPAKYGRPDFVKWVVNSLREGKKIRIVTDQINNPTYIDDLVNGIAAIIKSGKTGVFNLGGAELISRYDFTIKIADFFELDKSLIEKIITADLNQPAPRPLNSGLINLKAETELGYRPRTIEKALKLMKKELDL